MDPAGKLDNTLLEQARALVSKLEAGDTAAAEHLIDDFVKQREQSLYRELGKMTRQLHDALNGFPVDASIQNLAATDIPDAKARLNHVITLTEDSANRTLSAVEEALPVAARLKSQADDLFTRRTLALDQENGSYAGGDMNAEADDFLCVASSAATRIHANLSEVMLAQEFQDLTGQILRRVISLVQEVEDNLIRLIQTPGTETRTKQGAVSAAGSPADRERALLRGSGPQVPGMKDANESLSGQDEVDDLLSSLGF